MTEIEDTQEDTQKDKFLIFHLGGEDYGAPISLIHEIVGIQKITEVPDMPDFVKGVINLRGRIIPVIDMRSRFRMEARPYDDRTCVIVAKVNETNIGFVVDIVKEVINIPESQISPPPKISKSTQSRYVRGLGKVGNEVKILLDIEKLLQDEEISQIHQEIIKQ